MCKNTKSRRKSSRNDVNGGNEDEMSTNIKVRPQIQLLNFRIDISSMLLNIRDQRTQYYLWI